MLDCGEFENNMPVTLRSHKQQRTNMTQNIMTAKANNYTRDRDLVIKTDTETEYESDNDEREEAFIKIEPEIVVQPLPAKAVIDEKCPTIMETRGNPRKRQLDTNMNALPAVKRHRRAPKVTRKSTKMSKTRAQFLNRIGRRKEEEAAFLDMFDEHEVIDFMTVVNFQYE